MPCVTTFQAAKPVGEFPPSGVERAGGARGEGLIERLRESIRGSSRFPCLWPFPPHRARAFPAPPAPFFLLPGCHRPGLTGDPVTPALDLRGTGSANQRRAATTGCPAFAGHDRGRGFPYTSLQRAGCTRSGLPRTATSPQRSPLPLPFLASAGAARRCVFARAVVLDRARRARMGRALRSGPARLRPRPGPFLIVQARNALDAAWALEEGLKSRAFIAALGQVEVEAPLVARRLGLAAQTSRTPCLLLSGHQGSEAFLAPSPAGASRRRQAARPPSMRPLPGAPCLASHARALPGECSGAKLDRGVSSWRVWFPSGSPLGRSSG